MTELLALSVSVAVLGGIWAFIALGPLGGFALVWVGFIAAGCFFAAGGDTKALSKTIVGMIYGAIVAWVALMIISRVPVPRHYGLPGRTVESHRQGWIRSGLAKLKDAAEGRRPTRLCLSDLAEQRGAR